MRPLCVALVPAFLCAPAALCASARERSAAAVARLVVAAVPGAQDAHRGAYAGAGRHAYDYYAFQAQAAAALDTGGDDFGMDALSAPVPDDAPEPPVPFTSAAHLREPPVIYGLACALRELSAGADAGGACVQHVQHILQHLMTAPALLAPGAFAGERIADMLPVERPCVSFYFKKSVLETLAARADEWPGASTLALRALAAHWRDADRARALLAAAAAMGESAMRAQVLLGALRADSALVSAVVAATPVAELRLAFALPLVDFQVIDEAQLLASDQSKAAFAAMESTRAALSTQISRMLPGQHLLDLASLNLPAFFGAVARHTGPFNNIADLVQALFAVGSLCGLDVRHAAVQASLSHLASSPVHAHAASTCAAPLFLAATEGADEALSQRLHAQMFPFAHVPVYSVHLDPLIAALHARGSPFDRAFAGALSWSMPPPYPGDA